MPAIDIFFRWIRTAAPYRLFWLLGPLLLYGWTLRGPFISDDMHLILKAEKFLRGESVDWRLFRFARSDAEWNTLRNRGTCPWWVARGRQDFIRPVAELSFLLDVRFFGRNPLGYRLMSLGVFALALSSVHWMFRRAGADPIRAGAATFFLGISQSAAAPVAWVCNRADLFVVMGVSLAAGAYWSVRQNPRVKWVLLAIGSFSFALLAKEAAIALSGVVVLHELLARRRREERTTRPLAALTALLILLIAIVYLAYYLTTRPWILTPANGGGYPSQAATHWPFSFLLYSAVWVVGFPVDLLLLASPEVVIAVALASAILGLGAIYYLRKSTQNDPAALFYALWAILFILPGLSAIAIGSRIIFTATVGWAYLLTGLILPAREQDVVIPRPLRHWFYAANGAISIGCVMVMVFLISRWEFDARNRLSTIVATCSPPISNGHALISLHTDTPSEMLCSGDRLEFLTGVRDVAALYLLPPGMNVTTQIENDRTVVLRSEDGVPFGTDLQRLALPPDWKPVAGQTILLRDFTVELMDVRDECQVAALRLRFNEPLASSRLHLFPSLFPTGGRSSAVSRASSAIATSP